jgi:hypothetical protein
MSSPAEFSVGEVVAVACAIYRRQGFIKKGWSNNSDSTPNVTYLYDHFLGSTQLEVTEEDQALASELIDYLKGLVFKAFERTLSDFETNVLKFVSSDTVDKSRLGIAASLPHVYATKLEADLWTQREADLGLASQYTGVLNKRCDFNLRVENMRWIGKTNSYLVSCSENNTNIVKFFIEGQNSNLVVGNEITVSAYVRNHSVSVFSGFKETMLNRVRVHPSPEE